MNFIIKNSFETSKETIEKVVNDHNIKVKNWDQREKDLLRQIDGLKEEKYQNYPPYSSEIHL